jgi:hypothetical protein
MYTQKMLLQASFCSVAPATERQMHPLECISFTTVMVINHLYCDSPVASHWPEALSQKPFLSSKIGGGALSSGAEGVPYALRLAFPHPRLFRVLIPVTGFVPLAYLHNACTVQDGYYNHMHQNCLPAKTWCDYDNLFPNIWSFTSLGLQHGVFVFYNTLMGRLH